MNTDRETRTRIAAMAAAEAAIEHDPRDPFPVLRQFCARAAANLKVDPKAVYEIADGIVVEALVEQHLSPGIDRAGGQTLTAG